MVTKLKKLSKAVGIGISILLIISSITSFIGCSPKDMSSFRYTGTFTVEQLIADLQDEDPTTRSFAASMLGENMDSRAIVPLIAALKDGDIFVIQSVTYALVRIGEPAVDALIVALKDEDSYVRQNVTYTLVGIGAPALEPLITALKDEDPSVRSGAARALGEIGDARAVDPLIVALKDEDYSARSEAAHSLEQIGLPAVEQLIAALKEDDLEVVAGIYQFFIKRGEKDSEAVLIKVLNKYGTQSMADDFLNCGNSLLQEAGRKWADNNGYTIISSGYGGGGPIWGSDQ